MVETVRALLPLVPRPRTHFELQWDEIGLALVTVPPEGDEPPRLVWDEVSEMYAYKHDCFSADQVRLVFFNDHQDQLLMVTEDDFGFKELIASLPLHLPGFPGDCDWWDKVVQPPFATQWTCIFRRQHRRPNH